MVASRYSSARYEELWGAVQPDQGDDPVVFQSYLEGLFVWRDAPNGSIQIMIRVEAQGGKAGAPRRESIKERERRSMEGSCECERRKQKSIDVGEAVVPTLRENKQAGLAGGNRCCGGHKHTLATVWRTALHDYLGFLLHLCYPERSPVSNQLLHSYPCPSSSIEIDAESCRSPCRHQVRHEPSSNLPASGRTASHPSST